MAKDVFTNAKILLGGYDISGDHNEINAIYSADQVEANAFGLTGVRRFGGFKSLAVDMTGYWECDGTSAIDDILQPLVGSADNVFSFSPTGGAVNENAISTVVTGFEYKPGGSIGKMIGINSAFFSQGTKVVRGRVLATGAKSLTGNGTAYENGEVAAGKYLYGILHVTATSGSGDRSIDVAIQSAAASNFASPTTRISFTQVTTSVTAQFATPVAGEITDTWWRAQWGIAGTTPSFTVHVIMAII